MKPVTVFPPGREETDKTGKTYIVGNDEFLRAVFGEGTTDFRPIVVSFKGDPRKVPQKVWFGRPWPDIEDGATALPADANNYFSLATFKPDEADTYRRRKAQFNALQAVMLDDVGTKVPMDRLLIETDAPYLAPVPYRGKRNEPAFVRHVAELVAGLRGMTTASLGEATSRNFFSLFTAASKNY